MPTDQFDVLISQRVGLIAEQLAAPRNRDRFRPVIPTINEVHGGPPRRAIHDDSCCAGIARSDAPTWSRRVDVRGARMRAVADIDPRGAGLRAVTVVAWHATVICKAFGRDMDAQVPRRTRFSTTLGLRDDASKRVRLIASQVRRLTRSVTA